MDKIAAISGFVFPRDTQRRTSCSRRDSRRSGPTSLASRLLGEQRVILPNLTAWAAACGMILV